MRNKLRPRPSNAPGDGTSFAFPLCPSRTRNGNHARDPTRHGAVMSRERVMMSVMQETAHGPMAVRARVKAVGRELTRYGLVVVVGCEVVRRARDGRVRTNISNVATLDEAAAAFSPK